MTERFDRGLAADELQRQLRDLLCLAVVGDHLRWVVIGDEAAELTEWLADAIAQWRAWADQVAKHLATLGVAPDGRVRSLAEDISLNWVPDGWLRADEARRLVDDRLRAVAGWARYRRAQATDADTVQLLDAVCAGFEAQICARDAVRDHLGKTAAGPAARPRRCPQCTVTVVDRQVLFRSSRSWTTFERPHGRPEDPLLHALGCTLGALDAPPVRAVRARPGEVGVVEADSARTSTVPALHAELGSKRGRRFAGEVRSTASNVTMSGGLQRSVRLIIWVCH